MNKNMLEKYARLAVKSGVNLQKGQILVINSPVDCAEFTRVIAETAYKEGAKEVVVNWRDDLFSRVRFLYAPEEVFSEFPEWKKEFYVSYARQGAAFLSIESSDPEVMKGVDPERIMKNLKATQTAVKEYMDRLMSSRNSWSIAPIPSTAWAKMVFPGMPEEEAVDKLWEEILKSVKVDKEDPVAAWEEHKANLKKSLDFMNTNSFSKLHIRNSAGTDLTVELPDGHQWLGGSEFTTSGVEFLANMPTEEIFTLPVKTGVNGRAVSTKPLSYNGNIIDKFSITFKNGKVEDYTAETGYDVLKNLIETDEGSHYLGEVALVPFDSPISQSGILFYNTLFDENASCHLAIGKAYLGCIKDAESKTKEQLDSLDINDSLTHVDFMIGSSDLEIMGITAEGKEVPVFRKGNFAF